MGALARKGKDVNDLAVVVADKFKFGCINGKIEPYSLLAKQIEIVFGREIPVSKFRFLIEAYPKKNGVEIDGKKDECKRFDSRVERRI